MATHPASVISSTTATATSSTATANTIPASVDDELSRSLGPRLPLVLPAGSCPSLNPPPQTNHHAIQGSLILLPEIYNFLNNNVLLLLCPFLRRISNTFRRLATCNLLSMFIQKPHYSTLFYE